MIVEFTGLPGSGKTTVCRAVAELSSKWEHRKPPRKPRAREFLRCPRALGEAALILGPKAVAWENSAHFRALFLVWLGQKMASKGRNAPHLLLSEGIIHAVVGRLLWSPEAEAEKWEAFLDTHEEGVVIALEAPSRILKQRIAMKPRRGRTNQRLFEEPDNGRVWRSAVRIQESVLNAARRYRPLIRIDASQSLPRVVDAVAAELDIR